jgi:putative hydrolase of the HAD superfamily
MKTIDTVIFDLGNVLLFYDWQIAANRLCARVGKSRMEIDHYFMTTPFAVQLERGEISKQQFFETVSRDVGFDGTYEEFALIWSDVFSPNEPMIAVVHQLQGRVRRYVLSNTNAIHIDFISRQFPFIHDFDGRVYSYEVRAMKPDRRIYEILLKEFNVDPASAVFIDDILANVDGARAVGLHGIHYQSPDQVRQQLTKLGVPSI